uniref:UPF0201 protein ENO77_00635 n=1 Tax=Ignisphaera aggregans TaxID=334771 RepID=A0A7C2Z892_9CREN
MVYVRVEVEVRPTENIDKVLRAASTVVKIDNARIEDAGRGYRMIVIETTDIESLRPLYDGLRKHRILDTAREYMFKHRRGETVILMFNKQAAYQGHISLIETSNESPLGAIVMMISSPQIEKIIDWLAPRTAHGRPLWEVEPPKDA